MKVWTIKSYETGEVLATGIPQSKLSATMSKFGLPHHKAGTTWFVMAR